MRRLNRTSGKVHRRGDRRKERTAAIGGGKSNRRLLLPAGDQREGAVAGRGGSPAREKSRKLRKTDKSLGKDVLL